MLKWMRENLAVVAAIVTSVVWMGGAVVHAYLVKADVEFGLEKASSEMTRLGDADARFDERVSAVERSQQEQSLKLTKIATQQNGLIKTTDKMDKKLERVDDKLDQLLRR